MPVVHLEAQISPDELVDAAEQLSLPALDWFVEKILALRAKRTAPSLSTQEAELLKAINRGLPAEAHERYEALSARRQEGTLTPEEHDELLRLSDQVEELDAERLEHIASLARLQGVPLEAVLNSLGVRAPEHE